MTGDIGARGRDPLVSLWAEWSAEWKSEPPEGEDGEAEDRRIEESCDRIAALEARIAAEPATTVQGCYAQLAIILDWRVGGMSTDKHGHFARLREGIARNLGIMADGHGDIPAATGIDPVVTLYAEWQEAEAEFEDKCRIYSEAEGAYFAATDHKPGSEEDEAARAEAGLPALEEAMSAAHDPTMELMERIGSTPASTYEDIAIKLRMAVSWMGSRSHDGPEAPLIRTALEDFGRLTGATS